MVDSVTGSLSPPSKAVQPLATKSIDDSTRGIAINSENGAQEQTPDASQLVKFSPPPEHSPAALFLVQHQNGAFSVNSDAELPESNVSNLEKISAMFDVTRLTRDDRVSLAQMLRDEGFISEKVQSSMMVPLNPDEQAQHVSDFLSESRRYLDRELQNNSEPALLNILRDQFEILEKLHKLR